MLVNTKPTEVMKHILQNGHFSEVHIVQTYMCANF